MTEKKKTKDVFLNLLALLVLAYFLYQRLPGIIHNFKVEGTRTSSLTFSNLEGAPVSLPLSEPVILIFWATWCGPCKLELSRFKKAVEEKELDGTRLFAVDMNEDAKVVSDHVARERYPFIVLLDTAAVADRVFGVTLTPTVVHLEKDGKVARVSSGVNPLSVFLAKRHLGGQTQ